MKKVYQVNQHKQTISNMFMTHSTHFEAYSFEFQHEFKYMIN